MIGVLLPSLAVAIRRLHDTSRSGWWLLLVLIPIFGWIPLIILLTIDSVPAVNQYGPDLKIMEIPNPVPTPVIINPAVSMREEVIKDTSFINEKVEEKS